MTAALTGCAAGHWCTCVLGGALLLCLPSCRPAPGAEQGAHAIAPPPARATPGDARRATSGSTAAPGTTAATNHSPTSNTSTATTATAAPSISAQRTPPWPPPLPPRTQTDWCIDEVAVLDEETCFVLPEKRTSQLLIYLHGIVPPRGESIQKTNFERVVASAAKRAGVAALIPRGEQGFAPKGHTKWWSWPTSGVAFPRQAPPFVDKLKAKREKLERTLGVHFDRVYLAGSSAGAYFVVAAALHGALAIDGYGAMSGGANLNVKTAGSLAPRPFYIGYGKQDSVGPGADALAKTLTHLGWPVQVRAHATGHGAREVYLDEAFAFWTAARDPAPDSDGRSRSD